MSSYEESKLDRGLRAAFVRPTEHASVLDAIERVTGSAPRVVLREIGSDHGASPVVKPGAASGFVPQRRASYQVQGEIARGGMGAVLKAHDADLGRDVALKVLHETLAARPEVVQRFVEEAQIGGQLQHPGIVPVYELGLMADERPYFAMKLVKGKTLSVRLSEHAGTQAERRSLLDVFEAICQTMAYAHSRGVIHRDLKPANVLMGAFGEVQVVDWGLAKVLRSGGLADERKSREQRGEISILSTVRSRPGSDGSTSLAGSVLGTPAYMPPEQARGEVERLDERSDVFSLGAILCEILTGAPPYVGETERTLEQAARGDLEDATKRLERCDADKELVLLAKACLAPAQGARPRSAEVLAEKLHAYLTSVEERAQAAKVEAAEALVRAVEERRARKLTVSLAGSVLALVLLAGGGFLWSQQQSAQRTRATEQAVAAAMQDATLARGRQDWAEAHAALARANERLEAGSASEELRAQVASLTATIEGEAAEARATAALAADTAALLAALQDVRQPEGSAPYPRDWGKVDRAYIELFNERGIDPDALGEFELSGVLSARGENVEFAAAFDEWAMARRLADDDYGAARLSALASALDPDPGREDLRRAITAEDVAALHRIAASDSVSSWPAASLLLLADALDEAKAIEDALIVLRSARLRFPSDFVLAMALGQTLLRASPPQPWDAAQNFVAAQALRPESVEAWHQVGLTYAEVIEDDAKGLSVFQASVAKWPSDGHLAWHLGKILNGLGRLDESVAAHRRAVELDPGDASYHRDLGVALAAQKKLNDAIVEYRTATLLDPNDGLAFGNLGGALQELGEPEQAIAAFRTAIELAPSDAEIRRNFGAVLDQQRKLDEAIAEFEAAITLSPGFAFAHECLGNACLHQGKLDQAMAAYRAALSIDPDSATAHAGLGSVLAVQDRLDEATVELRAAAELDPNVAIHRAILGEVLGRQGKLEEAAVECRAAVAIDPQHPTARANLGSALWRLGELDAAVMELRIALDLDPRDAVAHNSLGVVLRNQGELDQAAAEFHRAIELDPNLAVAHENLGGVLGTRGMFEEAVAESTKAIEIDPRLVQAHSNLGRALQELTRLNEAETSFRRAIALAPMDPRLQRHLCALLTLRGDVEGSIACHQKLVELNPQDHDAHVSLAWDLSTCAREDLRDPVQALTHARRAVELEPENANDRENLGVALYVNAEFEAAIQEFERAIELDAENSIRALFLALCYVRLEDSSEAKRWYARAEPGLESTEKAYPELRRFVDEARATVAGKDG